MSTSNLICGGSIHDEQIFIHHMLPLIFSGVLQEFGELTGQLELGKEGANFSALYQLQAQATQCRWMTQ